MDLEKLKYPIGKFESPKTYDETTISNFIKVLEDFPGNLRHEVEGLSDQQLDTPYRDGGWTIRQVVNHVADSHMNGLARQKLALTEDTPKINAYKQDLWAELADCKSFPIQPALQVIEGIHKRWCFLLRSIQRSQWAKAYFHPEKNKEVTLLESLASYAWHSRHHLAHITELKKEKCWT